MASQVSVVVGASRGIGLELAKVLLRSGDVFATCRKESSELANLDAQNTAFHAVSGVDVETTEGCAPLSNIAAPNVDLVVLNAGVLTNDDFSSLDFSDCTWQFNTNALGPLRAVQALLPKLKQGSKVILIGSQLGSFGASRPGRRVRCLALLLNCHDLSPLFRSLSRSGAVPAPAQSCILTSHLAYTFRAVLISKVSTSAGDPCGDVQYGYRMSKCAAHMAARCLADDLRPHGITVAIVHPGTVQTDMVDLAGVKAEVSAEDSAAGIARVIEGLSMSDTGTFHDYLGQPMAW